MIMISSKNNYKKWIQDVKNVIDYKNIAFVLHRSNNKNIVCYKKDNKVGCKPLWVMLEKEGNPTPTKRV